MPASQPVRDQLIPVVTAVIAEAWENGCPVAGSDPIIRAQIASTAIRAWASGSRRGMEPDQLAKYLATRLIATFESNLRLVGPLTRDYEYLAAEIARVLPPRPA